MKTLNFKKQTATEFQNQSILNFRCAVEKLADYYKKNFSINYDENNNPIIYIKNANDVSAKRAILVENINEADFKIYNNSSAVKYLFKIENTEVW